MDRKSRAAETVTYVHTSYYNLIEGGRFVYVTQTSHRFHLLTTTLKLFSIPSPYQSLQ